MKIVTLFLKIQCFFGRHVFIKKSIYISGKVALVKSEQIRCCYCNKLKIQKKL